MSFLSNLVTAALIVASGGTYAVYLAAAAFAIGTYNDMDVRRRQRNARKDYNNSLKDRYQMVKSATEARKLVYGRARVSGPILFAHSSGDKQQYLHLVIALAGHQIDAIETIYLNDIALPTPNATTGMIESGEFFIGREESRQAGASVTSGGAFAITLTLGAGESLVRVASVTRRMSYGATVSNVSQSYTLIGNVVSGVAGAGNGMQSVGSVGVTYIIATGTSRVRVRSVPGTTTQAAFSELISESAGKWTAAHQLKGVAALYLRLEYDQDVFGQMGMPNVSAVIRGKLVRDPRTGSTVWSDNAALCLADYLRDATYGMGASAAQVPDAEVIAAANICDEVVVLNPSPSTTEARYTCNGVLDSGSTARDNLDKLTEAMAGTLVWSQGRWLLRAGAHRAASLTITEDMLADKAPVISPFAARANLINRVVPTYAEAGKAYTEMQAPAVSNATYLADDGGIDLSQEITYDLVTGALRAQRLAKIELERARQAMTVQLSCNLRAYDLSPSDTVALTLARYGWSGKLFTVVSRTLDPSSMQVDLTLRETAAAVWDWAYGNATAVDLTPNTSLPNPMVRPAVLSGMSAASGTAQLQLGADGTVITRALVSWTQSTDVFVVQGGRIELQWRPADATVWQDTSRVSGDSVSALIGPLPDAGVILIRARAVNGPGRASNWTVIVHTVVGKSAAPADVVLRPPRVVAGAVVFEWLPLDEVDYAATEIRTGSSWATGTVMHIGKQSVWSWPWPASGAYTLMFKHRDTSRNESSATAVIGVTVNADGTIALGYTIAWTDGAGNAAAWTDGAGNAATWQSNERVSYLVDGPQIGQGAVGTSEISFQAATEVVEFYDAAGVSHTNGG